MHNEHKLDTEYSNSDPFIKFDKYAIISNAKRKKKQKTGTSTSGDLIYGLLVSFYSGALCCCFKIDSELARSGQKRGKVIFFFPK